MRYVAAGKSIKGKGKGINQDSLLLVNEEFCGSDSVLAVVCDGIGGLQDGDMASKKVVYLFSEWFHDRKNLTMNDEDLEDEIYDSWENLLQKANRELYEYSCKKMIRTGTTATAVFFRKEEYYVAQIGDSRLYEISDKVKRLTRDQTIASVKARNSEEEKADDTDISSSALLQGVGAMSVIRPVYNTGIVKDGAVYLVCSDGFVKKSDDADLKEWICSDQILTINDMTNHIEAGMKHLLERGEKDDISAILIRGYS